MGLKELDDSNLVLGLGFSSSSSEEQHMLNTKVMTEKISNFEPSLTLCLSGDHHNPLYRQDSTGASSFSNVSVKREREMEVEVELASRSVGAIISDHEDDHIVDTNRCRKKLRLTKAQSELLEESFKYHSTLNPKQKQDLARDLKLRPRQVEVWFQNRRARTKLKQTEVECELLKKWCETLRDENKRLHKEVQDLKALQIAHPHHYSMQLPAATLTMCPSCEQLITENTAKSKPQYYLYNRCTNPSTAC